MATYTFSPIPAWGQVGGFARVGTRRNATIACTLPGGGDATVTQGGVEKVGYVESDADGMIPEFTTTDIPSVVLATGFGSLTVHSREAVTAGAASAASAAASATAAQTAQAAAQAAADDATDTAATITAQLGTYRPNSRVSVADLTGTVYVPHRGGAAIAPENTMEAFTIAVARGARVLEMDAYLLPDGALAVMHDGTLTRTTNLTGNIGTDIESPGIMAAKIDANTWFANTWRSDLHIPFLADVFRQFGGQVVLLVEAKNAGAGAAITNLVTQYGLRDSVIVASILTGELVAPNAAGLNTQLLLSSVTGVNWATLAATYDRVAVSSDVGTSWIASAKAAGLKADVWGVLDRRYVADPIISANPDMLICDDPWYIGRAIAPATVDRFEQSTYPSGLLGNGSDSLLDRGGFYGTNLDRWGYSGVGNTKKFAVMGHMCPVANPTSWTLTLSLNAATNPNTFVWGSVFVCAPDDRPHTDTASTGVNGYHILFRTSGDISVFRVTNGTPTALGNATGTLTPLTTGTLATYKVTITSTTVKAERTDVVGAVAGPFTDSTYRGGYFHLGNFNADATFFDVTVA